MKALGIVVGLVMLGLLTVGAVTLFPNASNEGYAPEQPIPFSHRRHAGENKIDCKYCHIGVEKSRHASVPPMNVCMNCHRVVKTDSPHIQKLHQYYNEGRPIEWIRVYELPDFVFFNHKRHIAKGVSCETCHGDVKKMDRLYQASPLTMGWCIDCHRGATTPKKVLSQIQNDGTLPPGHAAPTSCSTCHY